MILLIAEVAIRKIIYLVLWVIGMSQAKIQIDSQTVLNFWVPSHPTNKPNILFLHGFCANGVVTWLFQLLYLSRTYSLYVPDLLFFGESITESPERSTAFQAECLAKGLRMLGVEKCTCVGFSYGGFVGFKLAKMYPHLVDAIVVTGALDELTESTSNKVLDNLGYKSWSQLLLPESVESLRTLLSVGSYDFPWFSDVLYRLFLKEMYGNRKERAELLAALVVKDEEDAISPNYLQSLLLLWGTNDKIFLLEDAYNLKKRYGEKATLQHIDQAGHICPFERPSIYTNCLRQFLDSMHKAGGKHQD